MLLALVPLAFLKYPKGAPIVRSCSLAISAACHPLDSARDEAKKLLKYRVIGVDEDGNERVGLSSGSVRPFMEECSLV